MRLSARTFNDLHLAENRLSIVMMNGLRIYISRTAAEAKVVGDEFYSRRADGPYYRWRYEKTLARWRSARMNLADFSPGQLSVFSWKTVPSDLQRSLIDHYQE